MAKNQYYVQTPTGEVFRTSFPEYHQECTILKNSEGARIYEEQVRRDLLKFIKPGQTIYCTLRSVSSSGMSRRISLHTISGDRLVSLDYAASTLTGRKLSDKGGIVCSGCGMDMGFDLVYSLGYALWPNGTEEAHSSRNGEPDHAGGYALRSEWI